MKVIFSLSEPYSISMMHRVWIDFQSVTNVIVNFDDDDVGIALVEDKFLDWFNIACPIIVRKSVINEKLVVDEISVSDIGYTWLLLKYGAPFSENQI